MSVRGGNERGYLRAEKHRKRKPKIFLFFSRTSPKSWPTRFPRQSIDDLPEMIEPNQDQATVFIVQRPRPRKTDSWVPSFDTAKEYGRLEFIFEASDHPYGDHEFALRKVAEKLKTFDPDRDYILFTNFGDPACIFFVLQYLGFCRGLSRINYLYWTKGRSQGGTAGPLTPATGYYFPLCIDISRAA